MGIKEFHSSGSGRDLRCTFTGKTMRVDSCMNKHNLRNPNRRAVETWVEEIEAVKRVKRWDATFAASTNSIHSLVPTSLTVRMESICLYLVNFGEANTRFKQLIYSLVKVAAESQRSRKYISYELYGSQTE